MFKRVVLVVLLICIAVLLTAQYEGISREELSRRRAQLNEQAAQIKREARFDGKIEVTPETNRISNFRGNFEGIRVPAIDDTLGFERVFDEILDRVLPHFPVNRRDLEKSKVTVHRTMVDVKFIQTANGFEIEGTSSLGIYYLPDQELFVINNGLAYLDPAELPTEPRITEEDAIRIYLENVHIPEYRRSDSFYSEPRFKLMYCRDRDGETGEMIYGVYKFAWIGGARYRMIVDAMTGEIITLYDHAKYNHQVDVQGEFYPNTDQINYNKNTQNE